MEKKQNGFSGDLLKNRAAIARLASSEEAKALMGMLENMGGVRQAAQEASAGDAGALMAMVENLMKSEEGGRIVRSINEQAKQAGLTDV